MDSQSVENKLQGCLFNTQQSTNEDKQNNEWYKNQYYFLSTSKQKNKKVSNTSTLTINWVAELNNELVKMI